MPGIIISHAGRTETNHGFFLPLLSFTFWNVLFLFLKCICFIYEIYFIKCICPSIEMYLLKSSSTEDKLWDQDGNHLFIIIFQTGRCLNLGRSTCHVCRHHFLSKYFSGKRKFSFAIFLWDACSLCIRQVILLFVKYCCLREKYIRIQKCQWQQYFGLYTVSIWCKKNGMIMTVILGLAHNFKGHKAL